MKRRSLVRTVAVGAVLGALACPIGVFMIRSGDGEGPLARAGFLLVTPGQFVPSLLSDFTDDWPTFGLWALVSTAQAGYVAFLAFVVHLALRGVVMATSGASRLLCRVSKRRTSGDSAR